MRNSSKALAMGAVMAAMIWSLAYASPAAGQEAKTVSGVVKAVAVANQSLQITEDVTNQEFTFKVEETTAITKGDQTITLAEIKPGDKVEVTLDQGKMTSIKVK